MSHSGKDSEKDGWTIDIETHSRDDVLKVCALLAKGLGSEKITTSRTKVIIVGQMECGKGALVDALTAAIADEMVPYKLQETSLYEEYPCHAMDEKIVKEFKAAEQIIANSFSHDFSKMTGMKNFTFPLDSENRSTGFNAAISKNLNGQNGLDFETCFLVIDPKKGIVETPDEPCLFINFDYGDHLSDFEWNRKWSIHILDPDLQTPEMAETLDDLESFHQRRQARYAALNNEFSSPS